MKILFVSNEAPMSGNFNGASAYKFSHLRLLLDCYPDAAVTLLTLVSGYYAGQSPEELAGRDELGQHYPGRPVKRISLDLTAHPAPARERRLALLAPSFGRLAFFLPLLSRANVQRVQQVLADEKPDLIWTEQLVENWLVLKARPAATVVYSHSDFVWKIRQIRHAGQGPRRQLLNQVFRRAETRLIRRNTHLVSGSLSEIEEVKKLHPGVATAFLPTTYDSRRSHPAPRQPAPALVHLGTLGATANRMGLQRFLEVCWPDLKSRLPGVELHVIGTLDVKNIDTLKALLRQEGIRVHGFVEDLAGLLLPYDIHLIPYEFDTGTRTRLSLALNFNQLLISTRNACKGLPGLVNGQNCILVDSLPEMTDRIVAVFRGEVDRHRLADNGKALFEAAFTLAGQQPHLRALLQPVRR